MPRSYIYLTIQDRAVVITMRVDQCSMRSIARRLCGSPSTISRELLRTSGGKVHDAGHARRQSEARRLAPRRIRSVSA